MAPVASEAFASGGAGEASGVADGPASTTGGGRETSGSEASVGTGVPLSGEGPTDASAVVAVHWSGFHAHRKAG
jgi:hypothetical protein